MRPPKLKGADLAKYGDMRQALQHASEFIEAAKSFAEDIQLDANAQIDAHRKLMQKHLDRKDLRPHVLFRPQKNNVWIVAFNSETYALGPYNPLPMDDDAMPFWWQKAEGEKHQARSMFQALIAIVQDFCNVD